MKPIRVALVVVMILAMLLMASCGIIEYIIKAIANWSDQVFQYEVTQELRAEKPTPELPGIQYYDSLEVALEAYGVTTEYAGIHLPDRFILHDVRVFEGANATKIHAEYTCEEKEILFTIWSYKDSTSLELNAAEKIPPDAKIYSRNGIDHYIIFNAAMKTVTWVVGTVKYSIVGDYSEKEAREMIDSIYEG